MVSGTASGFREAAKYETELNERQREILRLIEAGHTNREIADMLGMSVDGAKWNVSEILGKLGLASREEAAEYWRWRHGGAWSRVRGWLGAPLLKLAGGATGAVVAAGVALGLLLAPGGDGSETEPLTPGQPFVLEAVVTQYDRARRADVPPSQASTHQVIEKQHEVKWWHRDSAHTKWEVTQNKARLLPGESGSFIVDGQNEWFVDPYRMEASFKPLEPGAERSVSSLIPFGPTYKPDIPTLIEALRNGGYDHDSHVEVAGTEVVLGRETVVIEFGVEERYWTNEGWFLTKRNRLWVDPQTMMVLRNESDSGRFVAEVTSLEYGLDPEDVTFRYEPGTRYVVKALPTIPPGYKPDPYAGMKLLAPFYRPGYLPVGFEVRELMTTGVPGSADSSTEAFLRTETGEWVRLEQVLTPAGMPLTFLNRLTGARAITFRGAEAWENDTPGAAQLGWWEDGVAFMLSSNSIDLAELRKVGQGLALGPVDNTAP